MSGAIKLTFQPLPNVPFLQGWPGIVGHEPWRKAPAVQGLLEVRPGNHQVKARHIQIELVRIETLPGGQSGLTTVGSPVTVWQCAQGKEWDFLQPADYKFYIPLPLSIPGSVELKVKGAAFDMNWWPISLINRKAVSCVEIQIQSPKCNSPSSSPNTSFIQHGPSTTSPRLVQP